MPNHVVKDGETIASIAHYYGLEDWRRIYHDPNNINFRKKRPNPNLIYPGDIVFVPSLAPGTHEKPTDKLHRFVFHRAKQWLRIMVEDHNSQPLAGETYELKVGERSYKGTTDRNGLLEVEIKIDSSSGRLAVGEHVFELSIGSLNPIQSTEDQGVSGVQGRLRNLGYPVGPIDGRMGPKTSQAIRYFQADENLPVTGEMDSATRDRLVKLYGG